MRLSGYISTVFKAGIHGLDSLRSNRSCRQIFVWNFPIALVLCEHLVSAIALRPNSRHWQIACLTHWGRMTHICVSKQIIIGSDNGLSPGRRQAIIWTNAEILLIRPLWTNFSEILIEIHTFSFKKIHLKMSSGKWRPFCLGLNVLTSYGYVDWSTMYPAYSSLVTC